MLGSRPERRAMALFVTVRPPQALECVQGTPYVRRQGQHRDHVTS